MVYESKYPMISSLYTSQLETLLTDISSKLSNFSDEIYLGGLESSSSATSKKCIKKSPLSIMKKRLMVRNLPNKSSFLKSSSMICLLAKSKAFKMMLEKSYEWINCSRLLSSSCSVEWSLCFRDSRDTFKYFPVLRMISLCRSKN